MKNLLLTIFLLLLSVSIFGQSATAFPNQTYNQVSKLAKLRFHAELQGENAAAFTTQQICTYSVSASSLDYTSAGGSGSIEITTQQGCSVTASSNSLFVKIDNQTIGENSQIIFLRLFYTVAPNAGLPRVGAINIGGQIFTINQEGRKSRKRFRFF